MTVRLNDIAAAYANMRLSESSALDNAYLQGDEPWLTADEKRRIKARRASQRNEDIVDDHLAENDDDEENHRPRDDYEPSDHDVQATRANTAHALHLLRVSKGMREGSHEIIDEGRRKKSKKKDNEFRPLDIIRQAAKELERSVDAFGGEAVVFYKSEELRDMAMSKPVSKMTEKDFENIGRHAVQILRKAAQERIPTRETTIPEGFYTVINDDALLLESTHPVLALIATVATVAAAVAIASTIAVIVPLIMAGNAFYIALGIIITFIILMFARILLR